MTEQDKARETARLLLAWADRKTLQQLGKPGQWSDYDGEKPPVIFVPSCWRVKPEPRIRWVVESSGISSCDPSFPDFWRQLGETVTEWQEVLP